MNRGELAGLIGSGENSGLELKRDGLRPERVARELAGGLLNLEGGPACCSGWRTAARLPFWPVTRGRPRDYRYVEATGLRSPAEVGR